MRESHPNCLHHQLKLYCGPQFATEFKEEDLHYSTKSDNITRGLKINRSLYMYLNYLGKFYILYSNFIKIVTLKEPLRFYYIYLYKVFVLTCMIMA